MPRVEEVDHAGQRARQAIGVDFQRLAGGGVAGGGQAADLGSGDSLGGDLGVRAGEAAARDERFDAVRAAAEAGVWRALLLWGDCLHAFHLCIVQAATRIRSSSV